MYRLDTTSIPQKWLFTQGFRTRYQTDFELAQMLNISERTARRWRASPQDAPRHALDYAAAVLLGHIVPKDWLSRGLHFDHRNRLAFDQTGESFALGCLENCDYVARLANVPEPSPCRSRRAQKPCHENAHAPVQLALLYDPPALSVPLRLV